MSVAFSPPAGGFPGHARGTLVMASSPRQDPPFEGDAIRVHGTIPPASSAPRSTEPPRSGGFSALSPRIAVVVNGNAKSVTAEVIETLDQILDSGDLFVSRRVEESEAIARTLVERGYGTILTGGGD